MRRRVLPDDVRNGLHYGLWDIINGVLRLDLTWPGVPKREKICERFPTAAADGGF